MTTTSLYPSADKELLQKQFVGKTLSEVPTPAAILDLSKVKSNCARMLEAVKALEFGWRAHVKTHKTIELTKLQIGEGPSPANIIVSTLAEAENVLPLLLQFKKSGRPVNLLYGMPVSPMGAPRLASIAEQLGPEGLSLLVDNPGQIAVIQKIKYLSGIRPHLFIKIDMGSRRAGVVSGSEATSQLTAKILQAEENGYCSLYGLYAHAGHSYGGNDRVSALKVLRDEFDALLSVAVEIRAARQGKRLVLSVGATPTATSIRNVLVDNSGVYSDVKQAITLLNITLDTIKEQECLLELHAGVYSVLDVQQLATHAVPNHGPDAMMTWSDLALTIVAEVVSLYPDRGDDGSHEALVGAGTLALGREPCKAYNGWGVVSPWNMAISKEAEGGIESYDGWRVGRINQEHGILVWSGDPEDEEPLEIGQKVRIWPNHACVAGAGYGWYLIVDSTKEGRENEIIDVWPRWRGW